MVPEVHDLQLRTVRRKDPFLDRRSGEDRRKRYSLDYFQDGNIDRRSGFDRRLNVERRKGCVRVSEWSSACPDYEETDYLSGKIEL